jgi:predicted XRE-type DNA-binding protein
LQAVFFLKFLSNFSFFIFYGLFTRTNTLVTNFNLSQRTSNALLKSYLCFYLQNLSLVLIKKNIKFVIKIIPKRHTHFIFVILPLGILFIMTKISYTKNRTELCSLLVKAREESNLTQKQVADTGIISQSEISKIENCQRKVEFVVLVKLAELYDKPIDFFKPKK